MDPNVPLVIPEINGRRIARPQGHHRRSELLGDHRADAAVADPPQNRIRRVILSTYQAASGAGAAAMQELVESTRANLNGQVYPPKVLPHPYAFNVFNHNTTIDPETGYNEEETKVIKETRKIFEDERIAIGVTCVRVPVLRAHCEAITFECERPITEDAGAQACCRLRPACRLVDDRIRNYFPMPVDASGQDDVLVGRIRQDLSDPTRPFDLDVRRRRPAAQGRRAERGPDRGAVAGARDGVMRVLLSCPGCCADEVMRCTASGTRELFRGPKQQARIAIGIEPVAAPQSHAHRPASSCRGRRRPTPA